MTDEVPVDPLQAEIEEIESHLAVIKEAKAAIRAQVERIVPVLEDRPLARYVPFGHPDARFCDACQSIQLMPGGTICTSCGGPLRVVGGQQYAAMCCDSINILCAGGNQSGKSDWQCALFAMEISGDYPDWFPQHLRLMPYETRQRPLKFQLAAPTYKQMNENVWPLLESYLPRSLRVRPDYNSQGGYTGAVFPNGAEISLMSYVQPVSYFSGKKHHRAGWDEPPHDREMFIETERGLLRYNGRSSLAMTPMRTYPWVDKMFVRAARSSDMDGRVGPYSKRPMSFKFNLWDNPFVKEERKEHWEGLLTGDERKARIEGDAHLLQFVVLKQWNDRRNIVNPLKVKLVEGKPWAYDEDSKGAPYPDKGQGVGYRPIDVWMILDPHDAKADCVLWCAIFDKDASGVVKKRVFKTMCDPELGTIGEAARRVKAIELEIGVPSLRWIDPNKAETPVKGMDSKKTTLQVWNEAGQTIQWPLYFGKASDNVQVGHDAVRSALIGTCDDGTPELAITSDCPEIIDACRYGEYTGNYQYDKKSPYKDWLDDLRYLMIQDPVRQPEEAPVGPDEEYEPDPVVGY